MGSDWERIMRESMVESDDGINFTPFHWDITNTDGQPRPIDNTTADVPSNEERSAGRDVLNNEERSAGRDKTTPPGGEPRVVNTEPIQDPPTSGAYAEMEQPQGMNFGVEIECFVELPSSLTMESMWADVAGAMGKDVAAELRNRAGEPWLTVGHWLDAAAHDVWTSGTTKHKLNVCPKSFWLYCHGNNLNEKVESYKRRKGTWGIERDTSLHAGEEPTQNRFAFEFVSSPILADFSQGVDPFQEASKVLSDFFRFFRDRGIKVYTRPQQAESLTSMHIHLSPKWQDRETPQGEWKPFHLMSLAMCSAWFTPALRDVLPKSRRDGWFCQEYFDRVDWLRPNIRAHFEDLEGVSKQPNMNKYIIQGREAFTKLADRVRGKPVNEVAQHLQIKGSRYAAWDRYAAWNYMNLYQDKDYNTNPENLSMTVEFRQPPGCASEMEALGWVRYAVVFCMQSFRHGLTDLWRALREYDCDHLKEHWDCSEQGLHGFLTRDGLEDKDRKFQLVELVMRLEETNALLDVWEKTRKPDANQPNSGSTSAATKEATMLDRQAMQAIVDWITRTN